MSCLENVYHPQFIVYNTSKSHLGTEAYGYAITGSGTFQEADGTFRVGGRNVVSFPGYYTEV